MNMCFLRIFLLITLISGLTIPVHASFQDTDYLTQSSLNPSAVSIKNTTSSDYLRNSSAKASESTTTYLTELDQIGGSSMAIVTQGKYAYVDVGPRSDILDISNPTSPILIGESDILPASVSGLWIENNLVYIASGFGGVQIVDVSNPALPFVIGSLPSSRNSLGITVAPGSSPGSLYAYNAISDGGLRIIDVSNPDQPLQVGSLFFGMDILARDVIVIGDYAYIAAGINGLFTVDIHDPTNPFTTTQTLINNAQGLFEQGNYLYLAAGNSLAVFSVSNPAFPSLIKSIPLQGTKGNAVGVYVINGHAYIAAMDGGLQIFNVSDPYHPFYEGSYSWFEGVFNVSVMGNYAYLAAGIDNLQIIDVTDPTFPRRIGHGYEIFGKGQGLWLNNGFAFVGSAQDGLSIVDTNDPSNLSVTGSVIIEGNSRGIQVNGNYAYLAAGIGGMYVMDVSNVAQPFVTGWISAPIAYARELYVIGTTVYLLDSNAVFKIDVSDPAAPTIIDSSSLIFGEMHGIDVVGNYAYISSQSGLAILDISAAGLPKIGENKDFSNTWDVYIEGNYAYLASGVEGLWVVDISDPTNPKSVATNKEPSYSIGVYVKDSIAYVALGLSGVALVDVHNPANPIDIVRYDSPGYTELAYYENGIIYLADGAGGLVTLRVDQASSSLAPDVSLAEMGGYLGEDSNNLAGSQIVTLGDINGDGLDDFAVTAYSAGPNPDVGRGSVYLFFGKPNGWPSQSISLEKADASFFGEIAQDNLGFSIAGVGDVNGDGIDDILVGAPGNDQTGLNSGKTYLIFGDADQKKWGKNIPITTPNFINASFLGEAAGDSSGSTVAALGDVNGDSLSDFMISAPNNANAGLDAGKIYIFMGKTTGWSLDTSLTAADASYLGTPGIHAGQSLAGIGDVNHDGYNDLAIGAWQDNTAGYHAGQVFLIFGKPTNWNKDVSLTRANASFLGEEINQSAGFSISGVGYANNDAYADFIIGAPGSNDHGSQTGKTYMILGKPTGWGYGTSLSTANASWIGEAMGDQAGYSVASAGDINQDGFSDFLIGSPYNDDGARDAGKVYLLLGRPTGWNQNTELSSAPVSFLGEMTNAYAGQSLGGIGDINGDGFPDLAIAAPGNDEFKQDAGKIYLIFGNDAPASGYFSTDLPFQGVFNYQFFTSSYLDLAGGYKDLSEVLITLKGGGQAVVFKFVPDWITPTSSAFYMLSGDTWQGPCYLNPSGGKLSNGTIELNCKASLYNTDSVSTLTVMWKMRVVRANPTPFTVNVSLQAIDISGNASLPKTAGFFSVNPDAPVYDLSSAKSSLQGEGYYDQSGLVTTPVGDVNGDGLTDFVISSPYNSQDGIRNRGKIYLLLGKPTGWGNNVSLSSADLSFLGEGTNDFAGYSVSAAGDVNQDGFDDFLIGAYGNQQGGIDAGKVYLVLGKATGWVIDMPLSDVDISFIGEPGDRAGFSLAHVGDSDGDQYDDFLIGAWSNSNDNPQAGCVYLILGKSSGWTRDTPLSQSDASFIGNDLKGWAGYSLAGVGDVDGNGLSDFVIGAPNAGQGPDQGQAGKVYLFLSKPGGWQPNTPINSADATFIGEFTGDMAGISVSSGGDVNGDGFADFLIGAWGASGDIGAEAGVTYLIYGRSNLTGNVSLGQADASFVGEHAYDRAGHSLAQIGDINQDGYDDFMIGASGADDAGIKAGKIYLVYGGQVFGKRTNLGEADRMYWGEKMGDLAGWSIAGIPNLVITGDYYILVGAPGNGENGLDHSGQSYLVIPPPDLQKVTPEIISNTKPNDITLSGSNFQEGVTAYINLQLFPVTYLDTHTLTATIPANYPAGIHTIAVINPDQQKDVLINAIVVQGLPPDLQVVTPSQITNNVDQEITLSGENFLDTPIVKVGSLSVDSTFIDSQTINAIIPTGFQTGIYSVTVTNPDLLQDTFVDALSIIYPAPELLFITPTLIYNNIDNVISIDGLYFQNTPTILVGTQPVTVTYINPHLVLVTIPVNFSPGVYDITLINPDGQQETLLQVLTILLYVEPPKIIFLPLLMK